MAGTKPGTVAHSYSSGGRGNDVGRVPCRCSGSDPVAATYAQSQPSGCFTTSPLNKAVTSVHTVYEVSICDGVLRARFGVTERWAYCATTGSNTALAPTLPCWIVTVAFL
jgi:hypothetical protein